MPAEGERPVHRTDLAPLFSPAVLGPLTLKGRIIKAATFEGMTPGGSPSPALIAHHVAIARGGTAMTTVAYCAVSEDGRTFADQLTIRPGVVGPLRALTDQVHEAGAHVALQLGHCGFFTKTRQPGRAMPLGPSWAFNAYGAFGGLPLARPMTARDLRRVVGEFARAAARALDAGFDAIELHLGHGYLLSQFLSPATNRRTDAYGGSTDGRMRLSLEVAAAVRREVGSAAAVLAKVNLHDGFPGGSGVEEAAALAKALQAQGCVDALVLSGGFTSRSPLYLLRGGRPLRQMREVEASRAQRLALRLLGPLLVKSHPYRDLFFLDLARRIRATTSMPLVLLGGVVGTAGLLRAIAEGFDFVQMGRALIRDSGLPRRLLAGDVTRSDCIHCNHCIAEMDRPGGVRCVLPPRPPPPHPTPRSQGRPVARVLVTGASGTLGRATVRALAAAGLKVRGLDLGSRARGDGGPSGVEVVRGDIRDRSTLGAAMAGCDAIVHLAAVLPPLSEEEPRLALAVNVTSTEQLIALAQEQRRPPRLLFLSSVAAYGPRLGEGPPRTAADPLCPTDHYTHHKVAAEAHLRASDLPWTLFRVGVAPALDRLDLDLRQLLPLLSVHPENRVEVVHPADVALAIATALRTDAALGRTLLVGGGRSCQILHRDLMAGLTDALGFPALPDAALGTSPYYTDWLDTAASEELLRYQRHSWEQIRAELADLCRPLRWGLVPARPAVRWLIRRLAR